MINKFGFIFMVMIFSLSVSCMQTAEQIPTIETSPYPTTTTIDIIPSPPASPTPLSTVIPIEVIFDGKECVGYLPEELTLGEHTFDLLDQTDFQAELWLVRLTNDKTFQDLLNMQGAPGEWDPKPRWAVYDTQLSRELKEVDGGRVETTKWKFYLVGDHIVYCYIPSPQMIFYAGPIQVVEPQSE